MLVKNLDRWDRRELLEQMEINPDLCNVEKIGSERAHNYSEFMCDVFGGLFKHAPEVQDKEEISSGNQWAHDIYSEISNLPEWRVLRERTKMNEIAAANATAEFCLQFMDALPKPEKKDFNKPDYQPTPDMSDVRRIARSACESATQEADETNEMLNAFAYGKGTGRPEYASPNKKKEIAKRLMNADTIKRIAQLAGRMRRIALQKQKQKTRHGVDEVADIETGSDLGRLIPAELAKLAHPVMKTDFRLRLLENKLLQYRLQGKERKGQGPLVVCIDESGTMSGQRDIWAKAVAMALLNIAQHQKRKYALVHFDGSVTRVDRFYGTVDPIEVIDAMSHFTGGGTEFMQPLDKAFEMITEEKGLKKADIIFVTDGESEITDQWLELFLKGKKIAQFNVISVMISCYKTFVCEKFSDKVFQIDNLNESDDALDHMFSI
ncbi:VWA domain-containing protein [Candidatus Pacearchaeota archaeon]|nr:VWA domain-containing protein [Candidatus Pacearchaeota archaeon]